MGASEAARGQNSDSRGDRYRDYIRGASGTGRAEDRALCAHRWPGKRDRCPGLLLWNLRVMGAAGTPRSNVGQIPIPGGRSPDRERKTLGTRKRGVIVCAYEPNKSFYLTT